MAEVFLGGSETFDESAVPPQNTALGESYSAERPWWEVMLEQGETINDKNADQFSIRHLLQLQEAGIDVRPLLQGTSLFNEGTFNPVDPYGGDSGVNAEEYQRQLEEAQLNTSYRFSHMQDLPGTTSQAHYTLNPDGTLKDVRGFDPKSGFFRTPLGRFLLVAGGGAAASYAGAAEGTAAGLISEEAAAGEIASSTLGGSSGGAAAAGAAGAAGATGGGSAGAAAGAAGANAAFDLFDPSTWSVGGAVGGLGDLISGAGDAVGDVLGNEGVGTLLELLAANYQYQNNQRTQDKLMEMYKPYDQAGQGLLARLNESYSNPESYLQGPEYQAIQKTVHNQLSRSDAAGGRNANSIGRQAKLQELAMGNLGTYREGLSRDARGLGAIGTGQGAYNAQMMNTTNAAPLFNTLAGMYGGGGN